MQKNTGIPKQFFTFPCQIFHFVGIPVFFMLFILIYKPMGIVDFLSVGKLGMDFNVVMLSSILLLVLVGTRLMFHFLQHKINPSNLIYIGWCFAEFLVFCAFAALYLCLISGLNYGYFSALATMMLDGFSVVVWPYLVITLGTYVVYYERKEDEPKEEESIVRFKDDNQRLKFAVAANAILYIEAKENYVTIVYIDGDKVRKYLLRSSMKRLEEMVTKEGLCRCQRAYFVNPSHVKVLRKDSAGFIFADLDTNGCPPIPVSKTFYDSLAALL